MVYEKDKFNRLIKYKDEITNLQIKNDLEWILESYNEYYINDKEYEYQKKEYKIILKKYYDLEEEKINLNEELKLIKRKYKTIKRSCTKL